MTCKQCGDEADELVTVKVDGKSKKVCESCADELRANDEIQENAEGAMQSMMEYKGKR